MKKTIALLLVLSAASLGIMGCDTAADPKNVTSSNPVVLADWVVDYGNGVYYFPHTQENFGNSLSSFLKAHPDLEVSAMAGNGKGSYGVTLGYFVTFRPKAQPQK